MAGKKTTESPVDPFATGADEYAEIDAEGMTDIIAKGGRVRLTLLSDGTPNGAQDQYLGVNGYGILVQRDVPVDIPACYVPLLNATETRYEMNDQGVYAPREVPRFNYRVEIPAELLRSMNAGNTAPADETPAQG